MRVLGPALQWIGLAFTVTGAALLFVWLGALVLGAGLFAFGWQLEREQQAKAIG